MTQKLYEEIKKIPEIEVIGPPQVNSIFAVLPPKAATALQKEFFFYIFDPQKNIVRWMTSFETTEEDISLFVGALKRALS